MGGNGSDGPTEGIAPDTPDDSESLADKLERQREQLAKSASELAKHLTAVLTLLGAAAFVTGVVSLTALAGGVGVAVTDFQLDFRSVVIVTLGGLLWAATILALAFSGLGGWFIVAVPAMDRAVQKWGRRAGVTGFFVALIATFATWFIVDTPFDHVAGSSADWLPVTLFYVGVALAGAAMWLAASRQTGWAQLLLAILLVVGVVASALNARGWGDEVTDGTWIDGEQAPYVLDLVLPVGRGWLTHEGTTLCLDRMGDHVVVGGDDKPAVLASWDSFVPDPNCERSSLKSLTSSGAPDSGG